MLPENITPEFFQMYSYYSESENTNLIYARLGEYKRLFYNFPHIQFSITKLTNALKMSEFQTTLYYIYYLPGSPLTRSRVEVSRVRKLLCVFVSLYV